MVDKTKRLQAADSIQKFMTCKITNFQFRDGFPRSKEDPALHAINTMLWFAYDDLREHRLEGKRSLAPQPQELFERCILFLRTDIEYTGIKSFISFAAPFQRIWNWIRRKPEPSLLPPTWPFDTAEQLERARQ